MVRLLVFFALLAFVLPVFAADEAQAPEMVSLEGKHIILKLKADEMKCLDDAEAWLADLDRAYEALADLVGRVPYDGEKITVLSVDEYPGGWAVAGNPILWYSKYITSTINDSINKGDCSFGITHEISHDFDLGYGPSYGNLWWWDTEFWANFKNDYTYETNKSVVYLDGYRCDYGKPGGMRVTDIYLMQAAKKDTVDRMLKGGWLGDAFHHKFAEIVKQVGWEPMKKVFRWYFTLSPEERQVDLLCNRSLFIHAIEEQSGVNISEQFIDWGFSHLTVADGAAEDAKEIGRMFRAKKWSVDIVERPIYAAPGEKVTVQVDVLEQDPVYFEKGLGTHPRSEIVYNLDGKYKTFESLIGIAGKANAEIRSGSVGFELIADGKRIYSSPVLKGGGMYRHVKQDISGVKELKLVTNDGGNGIYGDGCAWVDTKVIDANGKVTYLSDLKPVSVKQEYGELSPDADLDGNQLMFLYNPCKKPVKVVGRLNGKTFEFRHGSQPETYEYTFDGFSKGKHYVWLTINVDDDPITQHELVTIIVKDKE